jgi:cell division protein FtsB
VSAPRRPASSGPRREPRAWSAPRASGPGRGVAVVTGAPPVGPLAGRGRLTGRAAILLVVVAMLAVAYAWPVRELVRQRGEIAQLRASNSASQAQVDALTAEQQRWADPAYVEAQARQRLHFVLPGETAFVTLLPGRPTNPQTLPPRTPPQPFAWYAALWGTVRAADSAAGH